MNKKEKIYKISSIVTGSLAILSAIGFFIHIILIYSGDQTPIYSREIIGQHLLELLPSLILFILSICFTAVYGVLNITSSNKGIALTNEQKYKILISNKGVDVNNQDLKRHIRIRRTFNWISIGFAAISLVVMSIYTLVFNKVDGSLDPTKQVINLLAHYAPVIVVLLLILVASKLAKEKSYLISIDIIHSLNGDLVKSTPQVINQKLLWIYRGFILAVAITLIIVGAVNGEALNVLDKAVQICKECIGLG